MVKGSTQSPEAKLKMSLAKKGKPTWNKGITMPEALVEKNRLGHIGLKQSDETRLKRSLATKGIKKPNRKPFDEEYKRWMSENRKGKKKPESWKSKMRIIWSIPANKQKLVDVGKRHWNDPEYKNRQVKLMMSGCGQKPTNPEIELGYILNDPYPCVYEYSGKGKRIIGGMCPDFIHTTRNIVIELYGDYWHRGENPQDRIDDFAGQGYNCLIIWEHELKNRGTVINRIKEFHEKVLT